MATSRTDTFCALPWVHIACSVDGVWSRCCFDSTTSYEQYYSSAERPAFRLAERAVGCVTDSEFARDNPDRVLAPSEVLDSHEMRHTRLEMIAGIEPEPCRHCFDVEAVGGKSHRQMMNGILDGRLDLESLVNRTSDDGSVDWQPVSLELRLGNLCNLTCVMCSFPVSSAFGRSNRPVWTSAVIDPYADNPEFWSDLDALDVVRWIYFAGGEPFLQPAHRKFLARLAKAPNARAVELHYNSNLTVAPQEILRLFSAFGSVTVAASCDGVGETFETIRRGAKWPRFVTNLREVKQVAEVWLDVAVQRGNVMHLHEIIEFGKQEGVRVRLWNVVHYPTDLAITGLEGDARTETRRYLLHLRDTLNAHQEFTLASELTSLANLVAATG